MTKALVEKKITTLPFAQGVNEDNTTWKARGPTKKTVYNLEGLPWVSNK